VKFCSHFLVHEFLSRLFIYDDDDDDDDDDDSCCACSTPCSYRQPGGRGQLLSRRYCTQSGGCSRALVERPESPKALWRFRVSTSNSPSGRSWLHPYTSPN